MKGKHNLEFNTYLNSAHLYDTDKRDRLVDDVIFFLEEARKVDGPILELACGTGRVSIPLAQAGKEIVGIDMSLPMLKVFSEKLKQYPASVQNNVLLEKGDITSFDLNRKFDLIILPFSTFQIFCEDSKLASFLACVKKHLNQEGVFIFNCFKPSGILDKSWSKKKADIDYVIYNNNGQKRLVRKNLKKEIDTERQIIYVDLIFDEYKHNKQVNKVVDSLRMKYYYPNQLLPLLVKNGFEILEKYGYYDRRSFDDVKSTQMILKVKAKQ